MPDDGAGIFIPYDKLLQQQSDKLDKILDELREMDKRKLDIAVFESFRASYEQRHEVLKAKADMTDRVAEDLTKHIVPQVEQHEHQIADLQTEKAEREAVQEKMRFLLSGGAIAGILMLVNLGINVWQIRGR